jgi:hypothetical protein
MSSEFSHLPSSKIILPAQKPILVKFQKNLKHASPVRGRQKIYSMDFSVVLMITDRKAQIPEGGFGGGGGVDNFPLSVKCDLEKLLDLKRE